MSGCIKCGKPCPFDKELCFECAVKLNQSMSDHRQQRGSGVKSPSEPRRVTDRAIATMQRLKIIGGKIGREDYEVEVRVLAISEGYAMVRRPRSTPFVLEEKRLKYLPHS